MLYLRIIFVRTHFGQNCEIIAIPNGWPYFIREKNWGVIYHCCEHYSSILSGIRALLELFWSLVYAVICFILTPAYHFVRQICIFLYRVYLKLGIFIRYLINGFKWPEEECDSVPALTQGYVPSPPRLGRNHYGFGKLKV